LKYRTLGRTGVQISEVGLGGNMFGTKTDAAATAAIVASAVNLGINFIDTAESYAGGASEELLGKAIAGRRQEVVLATKTGSRTVPGLETGGRLTRHRIVASVDASLRRLGTDYVDLLYLHFPDPLTPLEESLGVLDDLVHAGKIRYVACSNYQAWELAEMVGICATSRLVRPAAIQMPYNLLDRAVETEMIPACTHLGVSLIPYSPLAGGFLSGKYRRDEPAPTGSRFQEITGFESVLSEENFTALERYEPFAAARGYHVADLAISWLLAHPIVSSVIAGATSPAQVEQHVRAAEWMLSADDLRELTASVPNVERRAPGSR
jgi:aryl-alcohol dehydrogenase-like predicted oxidoreductase